MKPPVLKLPGDEIAGEVTEAAGTVARVRQAVLVLPRSQVKKFPIAGVADAEVPGARGLKKPMFPSPELNKPMFPRPRVQSADPIWPSGEPDADIVAAGVGKADVLLPVLATPMFAA